MTSDMQQAVERIAEVVMFENWLRFYFIVEEDNKLLLRLPEKAMQRLNERYKTFYDLALHLNGREIDPKTSMQEVCLFVSGDFNGRPLPEYILTSVFDSPGFQAEIQLFSYWVQAHEEQLDAAFMEFSEWLEKYALWKKSEAVKNYSRGLAAGMNIDESTETIQ